MTGADPVKMGLVDSFSRPGGNLTGVSVLVSVLGPKRLELLLEFMPTARIVLLLVNPGNPNIRADVPETQRAAEALGRHLEVLTASTENELDTAFATIKARCAGCTDGSARDTCHISVPRVREHRRPYKLWDPLRVPISPNGRASRKDPQRCQAVRSPHPTEHKS